MKKLIVGLLLAVGLSTAQASSESNQKYQVAAVSAAVNAGYQKIKILGQRAGYCTIAHADYDFDAAAFTGVNAKGHEVQGVVCNSVIYLK